MHWKNRILRQMRIWRSTSSNLCKLDRFSENLWYFIYMKETTASFESFSFIFFANGSFLSLCCSVVRISSSWYTTLLRQKRRRHMKWAWPPDSGQTLFLRTGFHSRAFGREQMNILQKAVSSTLAGTAGRLRQKRFRCTQDVLFVWCTARSDKVLPGAQSCGATITDITAAIIRPGVAETSRSGLQTGHLCWILMKLTLLQGNWNQKSIKRLHLNPIQC